MKAQTIATILFSVLTTLAVLTIGALVLGFSTFASITFFIMVMTLLSCLMAEIEFIPFNQEAKN